MNEQELAAEIESFVRETFAIPADDPYFARDRDLFEGGYVDSVGLAELLAHLEEKYAIEVPEDDLVSDEFTTIDGMAQILARLGPG